MSERRTLVQFFNALKKRFPGKHRVTMRTCIMPKDPENGLRIFGDIAETEDGYRIRINRESKLEVQKDTLCHEYAHYLAGWRQDRQTHTDKWGHHYAEIVAWIDEGG